MFAALKDRVLGELAKGTHTEAFADGARFALTEAHKLAAPQPVVDREALIDVAAKAIHRWDKKPVVWDDLYSEDRTQYRSEAEHVLDAVLALINGTAK